jgi:hypothetical protein
MNHLPKLSVGVRRKDCLASVRATTGEAGVQPQQRFTGRVRCAFGRCINGRRLHVCIRDIIQCIPGSPGSPELGIPPGSPHCFHVDDEITHFHYHSCIGGFMPGLDLSPHPNVSIGL